MVLSIINDDWTMKLLWELEDFSSQASKLISVVPIDFKYKPEVASVGPIT